MSDDGLSTHPPKPRLTLRVGVTGKRKLSTGTQERVTIELAQVFEALAQVLSDTWEKNRPVLSDEPPVLRIICGLAEGADWLAAQVAVDRANGKRPTKTKCETRLAAILPFWREEFIKDFEFDPNREKGQDRRTPEELKAVVAYFDGLLGEARKTAVLELHDEDLLATGNPDNRDLAYVALRDLLVQHSDVLVAVFDETDERKPGGSADVTQVAGQEGVPIIRISSASAADSKDSKSKKPSLIYPAEPDDPDQRPRPRIDKAGKEDILEFGDKPPASLVKLLEPTLSPPPPGDAKHGASHGHGPSRSGRTRLVEFLDETFRLAAFGGWLFKACRDALVVWAQRKWWNCIPAAVGAFRTSAKSYRVESPGEAIKTLWRSQDSRATAYSEEPRFRTILAHRHLAADKLAVAYADATRSSYIGIASCGALAVFAGLLAVLFWGSWAAPAKFALLLVEFFILWWAGTRLFRPAHNNSWHERMVEFRVLAELLRHQRFIYAFGGAERAERSGERSWREPDAWLSWYVRATIRELGFPTVRLTPEYRRTALERFQNDELLDQIHYNERELKRTRSIDESLGIFVERAWKWAIALSAGGAILVLFLYLLEGKLAGGHHHVTECWLCHLTQPGTTKYAHTAECWLLYVVKPGLTVILAFLPALIAAVHGVRFQMEFANATKRAETTLRELRTLNDERVKPVLEAKEAPGRRKSYGLVRDANEAMVADLTGWSTVYKHKAAEPPG